ncbi:MAG TPA: DNA-processing protein DprA [Acidimicrobiales bacterium]|nr:DNA-processing protein DprA [Acidimicrobiales bacterium]
MIDSLWLPGTPPFPEVLAVDAEPPEQLWARGDPAALEPRRVAIIGTRRCTAYGRNFARRLGADLTAAGIGVVSGLALGIDGAAHEGVLDAAGRPIGVVATGLDVVYPRRHTALWHRLARDGLLLTEQPPGTSPHPQLFPKRNRIIAALAEIVIVVESAVKGGSMHTVNAAMARGIDVMAVPGPVGSPASEGTNRLLVDGVAPVLSADEVVLALGLQTAPRLVEVPAQRAPHLSAAARTVLDVLDFVPMPTDRVIAEAGLRRGETIVALQALAAGGRATGGGGWWARSP